MPDENIEIIELAERAIGYAFADKNLLLTALTHSSYSGERGGQSNERLEFLGDSVLGLTVAEMLYFSCGGGEGDLTKTRASFVSREPLSRAVEQMGIAAAYRMSAGMQKTELSCKMKADLFEAIVGAVYIDGGIDAARRVINTRLMPYASAEPDYKTELQEQAAKRGLNAEYDTQPAGSGFTSRLTVGENEYFGAGAKKREAEAAAAKAALADKNMRR